MNPFYRVREEAAKLRKKLLTKPSCEVVHISELLSPDIVEQKLDLGIAFVSKDSTELGGADAILRRSEDYIYVRDDVSNSEKAYLIAHELGHYILDEDQEATSIATLKSLVSAEGSPAVIKVEAYGARERLELRANVFARELLLPRSVARRLFEAGIGPRKVASDYSIHLEVVRQQMLDAVMLPLTTASTATKTSPPPSSDQLKAIRAAERFANIVAGPGSGKTTTLVHRVRYLIEEQGVDPSQVLVLTFTNKAAFELIERLRNAGIVRSTDVWAGTFHAFGLEFLRKYHQCFGLDSDVIVADRLNSMTLLNRELSRLELKYYKRVQDPYEWLPDIVAGIKRLKEEMVTPEAYRESLPGLPTTSDAVRLQREDVATLYECHERVLKAEKLVDFVDLVGKPALALKEDRPQYGEIADKFQYVLVDEYQDVTFVMVELIRQLAKNTKSLWVVGDVRQAIHHWRGASVHSLIRFDQTFKSQGSNVSLRSYPLKFNRRSSSEILDLVQQVGRRHVLEKTTLKLADTTATAGKVGSMPYLVQCHPADVMDEAIAEGVKEMHNTGIPYCNQAVLSRGNFEVEQIAARLRERSIPVLYIGELAQRREVKNLLCLMQLLVERLPRALVGLMGDPELKVEVEDLQILLLASTNDLQLQRGRWRYKFPKLHFKTSHKALEKIRDLLQGQQRRTTPWSFVCDLLLERRFGYPDISDQSIDAHTARIALWQFAYATRAGDGDRKIPTLSRFLLRQQLRQRVGETYADREIPPEAAGLEAVHMLTVHGSKGLEFGAVHLANVNIDDYGEDAAKWRGEPPILTLVPPEALGSNRKNWDFEAAVERNNLLYVAVSRARRRLVMYENGDDSQKRAPQLEHSPARYQTIKFTKTSIANETILTPPAHLAQRPMSFHEFETYTRCPLQHWYRYKLGLPGEQHKDIAIRARFAIMDGLKRFASDPTQDKDDSIESSWKEHKLPGCNEDAQLWTHAMEVFADGAKLISQSLGSYAEPISKVDGFEISLPWLLLVKSGRKLSIESIRFSGDLEVSSRLWRPMLNGLQPKPADELMIYSLLPHQGKQFKPSYRISSTKVYKSIQKFRNDDHKPVTGKHCNWCGYSTFCPNILL